MNPTERSIQDDQLIDKLTQIVLDNLQNEQFGVSELSQMAGISRSHLHRKLTLIKNQSISQFIREIRLREAYDLLKNNSFTASEVAYKVGFNNPSYFNSCFNDFYGYTPGEVKKNGGEVIVQLSNETRDPNKKQIKSNKILITGFVFTLVAVVTIISLISLKKTERSLAVLPLNNLTGSVDNDYFVDGIHDALIGELGQISSLRVISRTSTLRYRDNDMLLKDIADELGVNLIVEGSVLGAGDSVRLLLQVIDVEPNERHLMANEYRDGMNNILKVHALAASDISQKINLRVSKSVEQRFQEKSSVDPEVYKAYLRGMHYLNKGTKESFKKGLEYLHEAIEKDPGDPFAYAALALGYATQGHGQVDSEEAFNRAVSAANTAIKIDPYIDEAHTALSIAHLYTSWNWQNAKASFEDAIASNPNNAIAHAHFAWYHVLFNNLNKAIYHAEKATMLEPFSPAYGVWLSLIYFYAGEFEKAEACAEKALEINENTPYGNLTLGWISLERKQYDKAIEYHEKLPNWSYFSMLLGQTYVKAGQREKAIVLWEGIKDNPNTNSCHKGMMAAYLGYTDLAFVLLEEAIEKKEYPITYINFYPGTEDIRNDPRHDYLLKKMNLPYREHHLASN